MTLRFRVYSMSVDAPVWDALQEQCSGELRTSIMAVTMDTILDSLEPDDGISSLIADLIREDRFGGVESIDYFGEDD